LGRLKPQPFREIKRRLEAPGFIEASQKGSHVKFVRHTGDVVDTAVVRKSARFLSALCGAFLSQAHLDIDDWDKVG
jgi:predicted RNA binding protein YcfA (HicA-like mRNA interferase family)